MRTAQLVLFTVLLALSGRAKTVEITLLATTDLHGNIYPYDFYTGNPAPRGLAKVATLIQKIRTENPNTVLVDCGDVIQGAPLESVYQHYVKFGKLPLNLPLGTPLDGDPMMRAMNSLGYAAMVVGNHEFNFGLKNLDRARTEARFPWISSNIRVSPGADNRPFEPFIVKEIAGVRVAIIGVTTPSVPLWDQPESYKGYEFLPGKTGVEQAVARLKAEARPDLVIVAAHAGLGRDLKTGAADSGGAPSENMIYDIAAGVPGIDAIVFGHTHQQLETARIGNVLLMQPKNWGISLGRMDFTLEESGGRWRVAAKKSRLLPVTDSTPVDEALIRMAKPYFDAAEQYLRAPAAHAAADLDSRLCRVEDTPLVDAINIVQMALTGADVSFAACFNTNVRVRQGPVTVREIAALYPYDNTLLAIRGVGKMVRLALENAARYFKQCEGDCSSQALIDHRFPGFNFDMASGVEYEIDLSRPVGQRIRNLRYKGKPLSDDTPLRIAINSYRAGGSAGYGMFRHAPVLWRSADEIRDLIVEYYTQHGELPAQADHNWRIEPPAAERALFREASAQASWPATQ
ncbi:MAG TPA: 5'-nucleotidase C-terminal domain-containing protein [Bryobacteraceae bacterium]|nr:5'-nucleotidase C-terminal domain-containing protein [Bryobacteraceae bacterium]